MIVLLNDPQTNKQTGEGKPTDYSEREGRPYYIKAKFSDT
jgi:hypothetical protein